jgi:hypothetical protein
MKLLATALDDDSIDGGLGEDSKVINSSPSHENTSQSLHMTPTPAAQELPAALDGQPGILAAPSLMKSNLDDPEQPPQVVAADDKQEWEICDIVGKEDINGVPHYWVWWSVTLVSKCEMGEAKALVARFEAELRARGKQIGGKGCRKLPPPIPGKRAIAGVRTKGKTQKMVDLGSRCKVDRRQRSISASINAAYMMFKCGFYLSSFFLFSEYYTLGQSGLTDPPSLLLLATSLLERLLASKG